MPPAPVLRLKSCTVDLQRRVVERGVELVALTPKEAELLSYLLRSAPNAVSREELLTAVWEYGANVSTRTLDTTIYTLRSKIEAKPSEPDHVLTVRGLGYQFQVADLAPTASLTALQVDASTFIGRSAELDLLLDLVHGGARIVTIVGMAGTGKTRLARRFAALQAAMFPGGSWFCDLSEARSQADVCAALARTLVLTLDHNDGVAQLGRALSARGRALVILDNFEQIVRFAGATVQRWAEASPEILFLVTSREHLRLPGERLLPLGPLGLPPESVVGADEAQRERLGSVEAVALFVDRARSGRPSFELTSENVVAVCDIVRTLDGLPLAIELAAARCRVLSPEAIKTRLVRRFDLLTGGPRDASVRQATLRGAIDWSWQMLEPWEQLALAQSAVFRGGFSLEAAESVLETGAWPESAFVLDLLQTLHDKSLLRSKELSGGDLRFFHSESIRDFVSEKLVAPGALISPDGVVLTGPAALASVERRHFAWFAGLGARAQIDALHAEGGVERLRVLVREVHNLEAAHSRAVGMGEATLAAALCLALHEVYRLRGPLGHSLHRVGQVLALGGLSAETRARLLLALAATRRATGQPELAKRALGQAIELSRAAGDRSLEARAVGTLGAIDHQSGRAEQGVREVVEGLGLARRFGPPWIEAQLLSMLGENHRSGGHLDEARGHFEAALRISRDNGDRPQEGDLLGELAHLYQTQGRFSLARRACDEALTIHREVGNRTREGIVIGTLGLLLVDEGNYASARAHLDQALAMHRETGVRLMEARELRYLGRLELDVGDVETAGLHIASAEQLGLDLNDHRHIVYCRALRGELLLRQGDLQGARRLLGDAVAELDQIGDRFQVSRAIGPLGEVQARLGERGAAAGTLQRALHLAAELGVGTGSALVHAIDRLRRRLDPTEAPEPARRA